MCGRIGESAYICTYVGGCMLECSLLCACVSGLVGGVQHAFILPACRPWDTRSTPLPVMCGAMAVSCMNCGASDRSLFLNGPLKRYSH